MSRSRLAVAGALVATVVLAVVLRRWGWENWSLWLDECLQVFVARQPVRRIVELLENERNHPPLDYLLTHVALKISSSASFLRWIPTLLSAATAVLLFVRAGAARRPFAALGAAFSFAVLPFAVHQGQELRAYALALFLVGAADVCRAWHAESGSRAALACTAAASLLAVYSLYLAFLPLAAFWALDALDARGGGEEARRARRRLLLVPAATVLVFLPWVFAVRSNLTRPNEMPAPPVTLALAARHAVGFLADRQPGADRWAAALVVLALGGAGIAAASSGERRRVAVEGLATAVGAAAFLVATNHWFELRYFWFSLWPLARILGEGAGAAGRLARGRIPAFAGVLALLLAVEWPVLAENAQTGRPDWRRPVGYAAWRAPSPPAFVPVDWWSFMLLDYQQLEGQPPFRIEQPCLTPRELDAALARLGEGWVFRAPYGGSATAEFLVASGPNPWATFAEADGVALYRFEKGKIVPP
ncbi:MAG: hypothetical protein ABI768_04745 [Acidobacteriota bacterium]